MTTTHRTGTRKEWLAERLELLEAEKEFTRRSDELAKERRQALPWVRVEKDYRFDTDAGSASLAVTSSRGVHSFSFTTSCSGPTTQQAARPAQ